MPRFRELPNYHSTSRVGRLRDRMNGDAHGAHRIPRPIDWSVSDLDCSLAERRGYSMSMACERMPISIEPDELIVGMRTLLDPTGEETGVWHPPVPDFFRDASERESIDWGRSTSHNVPGFQKIVTSGLGELSARSEAKLETEADQGRRDTLKSYKIACDAAGTLFARYAALARELSGGAAGQRLADLEKIADACDHLVTGAPRDLHEAMQLYWLTWGLIVLEVGCLVSMGRIDQVLGPFWPQDPESQASAQELMDCFIIKCNDQNELWKGKSLINNEVVLSGRARNGDDATNAVTWAVLSSLDRLNMPDPQPSVRLHDDSPSELLHTVCEMWCDGKSQIAVFNDDVFIPALAGAGIDLADARDYAIDACQDVNIFGKSDFFVAGQIDLTGLLLCAIDEAEAELSWPDFLAGYEKIIETDVARICGSYNERMEALPGMPCPLLSVTMDDCIERGLDHANGGLAVRDKGVMLAAPVTAINSLAALKAAIESGESNLGEIRDACKANWTGYEDLRRMCSKAPKWGNDDDFVDLLGTRILEFAAHELWKYRTPDGSRFLSGIHQAHHVSKGHATPATPDGRTDAQPMSPTLAPANGTETKGPTAVMKSVAKIDPMIVQWNSSLTMMFDPGSLGGEGLDKFESLVRTWLTMRGPQLQINAVSGDTLRAAQADPESYQDLIVRVWGFTDRFVSLDPIYQNELIERTRHSM